MYKYYILFLNTLFKMTTALFIDSDNINLTNIKFSLLFDKIKNNLIIKRVYGDWKIV